MESVIEFAARRRARAGHLQRLSGPLRGAPAARRAAPNANLRFTFRQVDLEVVTRRHPLHPRAATASARSEHPRQALLGALLRRRARRSTSWRERARSCCATRPDRTSTARCATSPACRNEAGNVFGLMPHPEHAVDALTGGSTDGLDDLRSRCASPSRRARHVSEARGPCRRVRGRARTRPHRAPSTSWSASSRARPPNQVELAMYSLLWSEHCAYKHSKKLLRTLPTEGEHVVMGPGENAGAVDVGDGLVCAFKVESHNHPSAVEPFQGAATGVGGILRDIFAIGARPIAVLDSLRFGEADSGALALPARRGRRRDRPLRQLDRRPHRRRRGLLRGTLRAELPGQRDGARAGPARAAGAQRRRRARQRRGPVRRLHRPRRDRRRLRARLGRAGRDDDGDKRPTVQVGDPFEEKKLMECSLELLDRGLLVSLQDLGAAGLTSSASEMASQGWGRHRHRRRRACPCASATWRPSRSWSPSPRSGCSAWSSPRARRTSARALRALGDQRRGDRRRHRHASHARLRRRRARRRHARQRARRRLPAV